MFQRDCLKEQEEKQKEVATECTQLKASYSSIWGVPKMVGFPPKSSILIGFSITNHPFWGTPIFGNPHIPKKVGAQVFFVKISSMTEADVQASKQAQKRHGTQGVYTMVWPWFGHLHALQNLRQELENEQSRSSEVSAKLEELEATQEKKQMRFLVCLSSRSPTFFRFLHRFAVCFAFLIKCFVQILMKFSHEMYSQYDEDLVDLICSIF